jgi:hypothetical protein
MSAATAKTGIVAHQACGPDHTMPAPARRHWRNTGRPPRDAAVSARPRPARDFPHFPVVRPVCGLSARRGPHERVSWTTDSCRSARKYTSDVPAAEYSAERAAARPTVPSRRASEPRLKTDAGRTETVIPLGQPVLNPC